MSEWQKVQFESLFLVPTRNGVYKTAEYHGRGTKIVNMGELFANDRIGKQPMERIELSEQEKEVSLLRNGDLLFARRSLVESGAGKAAIVTELSEETTYESSVIRVRLDQKKCNPLFYLYWLRSYNGRSAIMPLVTGVNVKGIRGSELATIMVDYPSIEIQNRIVSALSAYDDLIETNQRQIKLLEEVAQRLYKEWFVDLRYPGHENVPVVDGIPEGWKASIIADMCQAVGGGTPSTAKSEYYDNGKIPWVTPTDLTKTGSWILLDTEKKITEEGLKNSSAKMVPPYTILLTSRASIGYIAICEQAVCTNQGFISCIPYNDTARFYLMFNLLNRAEEIKSKATGSTFLEITKRTFRDMSIVEPSLDVLAMFNTVVKPILDKMCLIRQQVKNLADARDRLLPKLMSGEIAV